MSSSVTTIESQTQKIDNVSILTNGDLFDRLRALSDVMANSGSFVPEHYRGKPDACMAVVMQAARWGMDPFAVAQKTFIVGNSGMLGYEAQLVNAVINTMAPTKDRIHFEWFGAWENIIGRFVKKTSGRGNEYIAPNWDLKDEDGVGVRAWATLKGETEPRELVLMLSQAQVRNSTLWASDPRQQLAYLAVKRWARLYCPDVILGVYTPDELEEREEKVINPVSSNSPHNTVIEDKPSVNVDVLADELRQKIDEAETVEEAKQIRSDIESSKSSLGALYNELKSKAVKRYRFVEARNSVEAAFNSLPRPDEPDATACFAVVEKSLEYAKKHLGDDLYSQYLINLNDIRPEYITA
ncbi:enterohemolysin [Salmonella enterica subsp. enterica serovar Ramatgan]|nr:enterohemolysin [Salmonella enterica subsp. enterica serovar Ramatgan]